MNSHDLSERLCPRARAMGLPAASDYILLMLRLAKQDQELHGTDERYRQLFCQD